VRRETCFKVIVPMLSTVLALAIGEVALQLLPTQRFEAFFPNGAMWGHWTHRVESWQSRAAHYQKTFRLHPDIGYVRTPPFVAHANEAAGRAGARIVFLGDSVTELGKFAEYFRDEVVRRNAEQAVTAIDAGVVGYDPVLENRFLRSFFDELRPDLVVLQFCPNDFKRTPVIVPSTDGSWLAFNGGRLDGLLAFAFGTRSRLLQLVAGNVNAALTERTRFDDTEMQAHLTSIRSYVIARGVPIRFAVIPDFHNPQNRSSLAIQRIQGDVFAPGEIIDMTRQFDAMQTLSDDGVHLNERGRRATARIFYAEIGSFLDMGGNSADGRKK